MDCNTQIGAAGSFERLMELAAADATLAGVLRDLALTMLERLGTPNTEHGGAECGPVAEADKQPDGEPTAAVAPPELPKLVMNVGFQSAGALSNSLVFSSEGRRGAANDAEPESPAMSPATAEELDAIIEQLLLKAEACRWALAHPGQQGQAPESLHARANGKDGHLWMLTRFYPSGSEDPAWQRAAASFEAAAACARTIRKLLGDGALASRFGAEAHALCADAEFALRCAVSDTGQGFDRSQVLLAEWLKRLVADGAFPVLPAPAAQVLESIDAVDLSGQARELESHIDAAISAVRARDALLNKARYHAKKVASGYSYDAAYDERQVAAALDVLVSEHGMQPSNVALRSIVALLPLTESALDEDLAGFAQCLRAYQAHEARQLGCRHVQPPTAETPDVAAVRELLRGRRVVLIGGDPKQEAKRRIEAAFQLEELEWLGSREHQSVESFKAAVMRPDAALVLLAIRWASHSYGEVKCYCDESGKPLVRVPNGYGVNQVAMQIMEQAGKRLQAERIVEARVPLAV